VKRAWDFALCRRALGLGWVAALLAATIIIATDRGAAWPVRIGTWAATLPACGALGAFGAAALARRRGEVRALCSLGIDPLAAVRGAVVGGVLWGAAGACILPVADAGGLYPGPPPLAWTVGPDGSLFEARLGISVERGGDVTRRDEGAGVGREDPRGWTALALAALSLSLCSWAASDCSPRRRLVVGGGTCLGVLVALASVGGEHAPGVMLVVPAIVPASDVLLARLAERRAAAS
jgi:hypothetical protein